MISDWAYIYPGVELGKDCSVGHFCILGCSPDKLETESRTKIDSGALIRSHTVIYAGNIIGSKLQTGNKVNIRENNVIGDRVSVGTLTVIEHNVRIEDDVRIHSQVFVPEFSTLEQECWIGPNAVLTNAKYPQSPDVKETLLGPTIGRGARIGANATILPGIRVGERSLVGAGSVVSRDVPDGVVVAGNPARIIRAVDY